MLVTHRSFLPAGMKLLDCYPRYKYCVFPKWDTPARNATKICFPTFLEGCGGPSRNQINYVNKIIDLHVFFFVENERFFKGGDGGEREGAALYNQRVPFSTSCYSKVLILIYVQGILETRSVRIP